MSGHQKKKQMAEKITRINLVISTCHHGLFRKKQILLVPNFRFRISSVNMSAGLRLDAGIGSVLRQSENAYRDFKQNMEFNQKSESCFIEALHAQKNLQKH